MAFATLLNINDPIDEGRIEKALVGRKIKSIRLMTEMEMQLVGWMDPGTIIVLDNGTELYASADIEGNDHGILCYNTKSNQFMIGG